MKTVLHQNTTRANELRHSHTRMVGIYQRIYDAYNALGLKAAITKPSELSIRNPEQLVREAIYRENQTLQSLPLKKEAVLQMIDLPEGFQEFVEATKPIHWADRFLGDIQQHFISIENGRVVLLPEFDQWVTDTTSLYATEQETEALQDAQSIYEQLQAFKEKYPQVRLLPADTDAYQTLFYSSKGKLYMRSLSVRTANN